MFINGICSLKNEIPLALHSAAKIAQVEKTLNICTDFNLGVPLCTIVLKKFGSLSEVADKRLFWTILSKYLNKC
jgi:hypothetical protein